MPSPRPRLDHRRRDFGFFQVAFRPGYGFIVERGPAVMVVPLAADGRVWLLRIFRVPLGVASWEVAGGAIEPGERPIEAGLRELREEAGLVARGRARLLRPALEPLPGMAAFPHHVILAEDVAPEGRRPRLAPEEGVLAVRRFSRDALGRMASRGTLTVQATLAALARAGVL